MQVAYTCISLNCGLRSMKIVKGLFFVLSDGVKKEKSGGEKKAEVMSQMT